MKFGRLIVIAFLMTSFLCGCAWIKRIKYGLYAMPRSPRTYKKTIAPSWQQVILKPGVTYDDAWPIVINALTYRYAIKEFDKDSGYINTEWCYSSTGEQKKTYRCRIIVRFKPDRKSLQLKADCEYEGLFDFVFTREKWTSGTDSRASEDIYGELKAKIGQR